MARTVSAGASRGAWWAAQPPRSQRKGSRRRPGLPQSCPPWKGTASKSCTRLRSCPALSKVPAAVAGEAVTGTVGIAPPQRGAGIALSVSREPVQSAWEVTATVAVWARFYECPGRRGQVRQRVSAGWWSGGSSRAGRGSHGASWASRAGIGLPTARMPDPRPGHPAAAALSCRRVARRPCRAGRNN